LDEVFKRKTYNEKKQEESEQVILPILDVAQEANPATTSDKLDENSRESAGEGQNPPPEESTESPTVSNEEPVQEASEEVSN
jgi:hypothetical protein